jgi:imidazolonepropionase-like amidohydrolase
MRACCLLILFVLPLLIPASVDGQQATSLSPLVQKYVRVNAPKVVLERVRVIDGTGQHAVGDRNVVIEHGKITAVDAGSDTPASDGTTVLDLRGYTVIPGIIGMHNHFFYTE